METNDEDRFKSKRKEITIAVIGLLGVLATAIFSNWDKVFSGKQVVQASYSGYRATGNYETELRYYFEVSGVRATMENMTQQLASSTKMALTAKYPEDAKQIDAIMSVALEESVTYDDVMKKLLPVYRKYFTVEEIQELNKFYSTEIMQNMGKKMPLLTQEAAPLQVDLMQDFQKRFKTRVGKILQREAPIKRQ